MIQFHEHIFRMGRNHQLLKIFNHTKRRLFFLCSLGNSGKNESISLGVENSGNAAMNSEVSFRFRNDYRTDFWESRTFSRNPSRDHILNSVGMGRYSAAFIHHLRHQVTWRTWRSREDGTRALGDAETPAHRTMLRAWNRFKLIGRKRDILRDGLETHKRLLWAGNQKRHTHKHDI